MRAKGGAESVTECVGLRSSLNPAIGVPARAASSGSGGGRVTEAIDLGRMLNHNISLRGGVAPVRAYIPDLMDHVLAGKIYPSASSANEHRSRGRSRKLCRHGLAPED